MPMYEYLCKDCEGVFTVQMRLSDYEKNKDQQQCPGCGSSNLARTISAIEVQTSKKS